MGVIKKGVIVVTVIIVVGLSGLTFVRGEDKSNDMMGHQKAMMNSEMMGKGMMEMMDQKKIEPCMRMKHGMMMRCVMGEGKIEEKASPEIGNKQINLIDEKNPISADEKSIAQGKIVFAQNCTGCHGITGEGNGPTAEYFHGRVANLTNPKLKKKSDHELFEKITDGSWPMPAFGFSLSKEDIWNAINYIRTLSKQK